MNRVCRWRIFFWTCSKVMRDCFTSTGIIRTDALEIGWSFFKNKLNILAASFRSQNHLIFTHGIPGRLSVFSNFFCIVNRAYRWRILFWTWSKMIRECFTSTGITRTDALENQMIFFKKPVEHFGSLFSEPKSSHFYACYTRSTFSFFKFFFA